jgi:hypothetical protein
MPGFGCIVESAQVDRCEGAMLILENVAPEIEGDSFTRSGFEKSIRRQVASIVVSSRTD